MARALRNALTRGICARTRPSGNQGRSKTREGPEDGELACGHKDPFPLLARRSVWPPRSRPAVRLAWRSCGNVDSTAHPGTLGQDGPKVRQTNLQRARSLDKGGHARVGRQGQPDRPAGVFHRGRRGGHLLPLADPGGERVAVQGAACGRGLGAVSSAAESRSVSQ